MSRGCQKFVRSREANLPFSFRINDLAMAGNRAGGTHIWCYGMGMKCLNAQHMTQRNVTNSKYVPSDVSTLGAPMVHVTIQGVQVATMTVKMRAPVGVAR